MAIAKLLLFLVSTVARHYGSTSPNARPPTDQLREQRGAERAIPWLTASGSLLLWSWALFEGSLLFALSGYCPPTLAQPVYYYLPVSDPTALTALTPTFLAGTVLTLAGALLRVHCYRTLGASFTFELSIRPTHTLITHGAYGVVRHPSYTAVAGTLFGSLLCVLDRRGCVVSALAGSADVTGILACIWTTTLVMAPLGLYKRMNKEDTMLEKEFGEAWRAWAKEVPWRVVPGVY